MLLGDGISDFRERFEVERKCLLRVLDRFLIRQSPRIAAGQRWEIREVAVLVLFELQRICQLAALHIYKV